MKPEKIYQELKDIAEKLGVGVEEHNFRNTGIHVKSGACVVRGKHMVIIDKHKSISRKIRVLAAALSKLPHESVYMVPAVRDIIARHAEE
jgi:signal recognition particle subunit SEC65